MFGRINNIHSVRETMWHNIRILNPGKTNILPWKQDNI